MASLMQHIVGKKFESVTGEFDKKSDKGSYEEDPEVAEARREAEEKRTEKYRKQEEEREHLRQEIREKYGLKKKDKETEEARGLEGRIGRKKKPTAAELEEIQKPVQQPSEPEGLGARLSSSVSEAADKCLVQ